MIKHWKPLLIFPFNYRQLTSGIKTVEELKKYNKGLQKSA